MGVKGIWAVVVEGPKGADARAIRMCFRHAEFPGVLIACRSWLAGTDPHERVWLIEEIATGALRRVTQSQPAVADADEVVWIQFDERCLVARPRAAST